MEGGKIRRRRKKKKGEGKGEKEGKGKETGKRLIKIKSVYSAVEKLSLGYPQTLV